ncbi:histone H4 transcription factor-like [Saccostrea echinata]|uniref:histone H4 transcription factor-like n=1 Tax=Saccostrea echinata TaxID=191078 RepID=UPI002A83FEB0|nr:histone H4 transcription factor-like [Saccostrea echinata]
MASKKRRASRAGLRKLPLSLMCEWASCKETFLDMEQFTNHLKAHLTGVTSNGIMEEATEYRCLWRDCEMTITGHVTDFVRHVYFHSFHVKIKCLGSQMVRSLKLQGCQLDEQSRNLIPELPERLQCGWKECETIMDIPEAFYRHVDSHALSFPEGNNVPGGCKCSWEGCDAVSKSKYKLREHLRSHTQEKIVACPICGGLFSSRTKFLDHLKRQEETDHQCYQCSHCDKRYTTERLLRDHVRHHVNQYKCPCCDMTCPTPSSLKTHLRYRHTTQTPYKCDHCGHGAKSLADLKKHLESHSVDVPYHCHIPDCSYTSRTFQSLENHFKRLHQDIDVQKYKCHVCSTLFTRGTNLTSHLKKKHKFRWPSGHSRFRYKMQEDGYLQLQTVRYESIKLTEQMENGESESTSEVDKGQLSSTETEEVNSRNKKRRRTLKKEKENTASSSKPHDVLHQDYNVCRSDQSDGIPVSTQITNLRCNSDEVNEQTTSHVAQVETRYQYVSFVELPPNYLDLNPYLKEVPHHVPQSEVIQPVTVGSSSLDVTRELYSDNVCPISEREPASEQEHASQQPVSDEDRGENYNLEMLGDVALRAPPEKEISSPGKTRKRKQTLTNKCRNA